jgi:hypothetical protein
MRSAALIPCFVVLGCGGPATVTAPADPVSSSMMKIVDAYRTATIKLNHPPRNMEELKPSLKEKGVTDDMLKSPRDGQPYMIIWGIDITKPPTSGDPRNMPVIIYEKEGAGGKRWVVTQFSPQEMTDEEFAQANVPKAKSK